jgi:hypothetical protein
MKGLSNFKQLKIPRWIGYDNEIIAAEILEDILPAKYFNHFCMFIYGLNVSLQEKVSVENLKKCEALFKKFVKDTVNIYGVEQVGINVHFLSHLFQCVLDWGCL